MALGVATAQAQARFEDPGELLGDRLRGVYRVSGRSRGSFVPRRLLRGTLPVLLVAFAVVRVANVAAQVIVPAAASLAKQPHRR
jgi:hypothetical protein